MPRTPTTLTSTRHASTRRPALVVGPSCPMPRDRCPPGTDRPRGPTSRRASAWCAAPAATSAATEPTTPVAEEHHRTGDNVPLCAICANDYDRYMLGSASPRSGGAGPVKPPTTRETTNDHNSHTCSGTCQQELTLASILCQLLNHYTRNKDRGMVWSAVTPLWHPGRMPFSTRPELRTFGDLTDALGPLGFPISQKVRVIDVVRAAAEAPEVSTPVGPKLGDMLYPALRAMAGEFRPDHPWLRPGDWSYAMNAHFDFVVHSPLDSDHPTHPLFAVEFDGATTHSSTDARRRDLAKNRLCAASGLPLLRIGDTFLQRRERLSLVAWLAELWAAYRDEMPRLMAQRDADLEDITQEEKDEAGQWLLCEYPHLDVDLLFRLAHPFPPVVTAGERLAERHGFQWTEVRGVEVAEPRWRVGSWLPPIPSLDGGLTERWRCELELKGQRGERAELRGLAVVPTAYPLYEDSPIADKAAWDMLIEHGRFDTLAAGPWTSAPSLVGEALCLHNALLEVEHYLRRHDRP